MELWGAAGMLPVRVVAGRPRSEAFFDVVRLTPLEREITGALITRNENRKIVEPWHRLQRCFRHEKMR